MMQFTVCQLLCTNIQTQVDTFQSLRRRQWLRMRPLFEHRLGFCILCAFVSVFTALANIFTIRLLHWLETYSHKHTANKQLPDFLYKGTQLTIWRDETTLRVWRQRGVRELQQRGRALLSRLKVERGCQQARNSLVSLQREPQNGDTAQPFVFAINYLLKIWPFTR